MRRNSSVSKVSKLTNNFNYTSNLSLLSNEFDPSRQHNFLRKSISASNFAQNDRLSAVSDFKNKVYHFRTKSKIGLELPEEAKPR